MIIIITVLLEKLLLKCEGTKYTVMLKRLKATYPDSEICKKDISDRIDIIAKKRHKFVHESIDTITRQDRSFAKDLVEHLLKFLFKNLKKLKNVEMLEFFYENLYKYNQKTLQNRSKVLELLEDPF